MSFRTASSPHTRAQNKTANIMMQVALACLPGIAMQVWYFGIGVIVQILLAVIAAIATEYLCLRLRKRPLTALQDHSALLTGVLLGICLPALAPWWVAVIGSVFAVALAKHVYGGLGQNIFNPAMAGYVVLLISFPVAMTGWLPPSSLVIYEMTFSDTISVIFTGYSVQGYSVEQLRSDIDGITMATPLDTVKTALAAGLTYQESLSSPIFSSSGTGKGWFAISIAYFAGGLYLLKQGIIRWHIPFSFLSALLVFSFIAHATSPDGVASPLIHLTSGATMFAAFFILTDPVSASTTNKGRLIYGALVAFLVIIIRIEGGYPDGVAFAVLLANMCVPLIDYYTKPTAYGHARS